MKRILIIGGVAAGATAAARARRVSEEADITVLESGPDISFANCGLPYYLGRDIDRRSKLILQSPESFREQYNVHVEVETEVTAIDREARIVRALQKSTGREVEHPYDELILAQGGKPVIPPIPGVEQPHVFSLWTLRDMDAIDDWLEHRGPQSAVVVGGGFIGLEMVEALRKRGLEVHVVERLPHVMPGLEPELAGYLTAELTAHGVGVHTSASVTRIGTSQVELDDGSTLGADMVLMSVGVKPTLTLAEQAGLTVGATGGLVVDEYLQTNDPHIYAAGDMVEIEHTVSGKTVRIPLAGPANRQGRIAASNALGERRRYSGAQGTSVVKVFDAAAGSTGLSVRQAREAGFEADSIVVHKENHTSYFPGATPVTVLVVYDRETGRILGGQTAGEADADKRLDVFSTAIAGGLTVGRLGELDLAYAPPFGTANDAVNMAAFVAENRLSGVSPSLTAAELDGFAEKLDNPPAVIDLRDPFSIERAHIRGSYPVALKELRARTQEVPREYPILLLSDDGKKGHQALRKLTQAGFSRVFNVSGGFTSIERHARAVGFTHFDVVLPAVELKLFHAASEAAANGKAASEAAEATEAAGGENGLGGSEPLIVDVRTPEEFEYGAVPGAVNIPLDDLGVHSENLGAKDREITVYCASGARSAYAVRMLTQMGFANVHNGGGVMDMMARRR
ncbi:MAG: FAD-dependent oxidoreductase [Spirochaetota bacterium]